MKNVPRCIACKFHAVERGVDVCTRRAPIVNQRTGIERHDSCESQRRWSIFDKAICGPAGTRFEVKDYFAQGNEPKRFHDGGIVSGPPPQFVWGTPDGYDEQLGAPPNCGSAVQKPDKTVKVVYSPGDGEAQFKAEIAEAVRKHLSEKRDRSPLKHRGQPKAAPSGKSPPPPQRGH